MGPQLQPTLRAGKMIQTGWGGESLQLAVPTYHLHPCPNPLASMDARPSSCPGTYVPTRAIWMEGRQECGTAWAPPGVLLVAANSTSCYDPIWERRATTGQPSKVGGRERIHALRLRTLRAARPGYRLQMHGLIVHGRQLSTWLTQLLAVFTSS